MSCFSRARRSRKTKKEADAAASASSGQVLRDLALGLAEYLGIDHALSQGGELRNALHDAPCVFGGGALDKVPVPARERVRVHDDRGGDARFRQAERGQPVGKAGSAVLQKHEILYAGDLIVAEIEKELCALRLRVQEDAAVAARKLHLAKVRDDLVEQAFALMIGGDRKAADRVVETAAGREQVPVVVKDAAGVIQMRVTPDAGAC